MKHINIIILFYTLATTSYASVQFTLFPEVGKYVYSLSATVSAGTTLPNHLTSLFALKGSIDIKKYSNSLIIQLNGIKHTIYNNDNIEDLSENIYHELDIKTEILKLPFIVNFDDSGAIHSLNFTDKELLWSINIKRSIAISLQMQTKNRPLPGGFIIDNEPCLHGTCRVEYSSSDGIHIRKTNNVPTLVPSPTHDLWMSVMSHICTKDTKNPLIGNADKLYKLDEKGLLKLISEGNIQIHYHNHIFHSHTNLTIERMYIVNESVNALENCLLQKNVAFEPPNRQEPTGGRSPISPDKQLRMLWHTLAKIADGLEQPGLRETLLKDKLPLRLQEIISTLSYETLKKAHYELELGTSYKWETMKNIFLEVLPQVNSRAAVLLVRDLIVNKEISDETTILNFLRKMPFNIIDFSQNLLVEMEPLIKLNLDHSREVRHAAILAFSTLVFKAYLNEPHTKDTFEDYVQIFFSRFTESPEYADRFVWLSGLSNLQMDHVTSYLAPVISGTLGHSTNERFLAVWATMPMVHLYAHQVPNIYWPILHNEDEPLEMRVAAVTMLLLSEPTPHRLLSLHWYISSQNNEHLTNYFYTTVKSLEQTTFDCYKHMAKTASYISKIIKKPKNNEKLWATGNYLFDIADTSRDMGFMIQSVMIANPHTGLPHVMYKTLITHNAGLIVQDYSVYLKLQGVVSNSIENIHSTMKEPLHISQIMKVLQQLKVEPQPVQPIHVEFLLKYQGKIIYTLHLNQTNFDKWIAGDMKKTIDNLIKAESHINQQVLLYPTILKSTLPSEIGTPIITDTMLSSLTSIRGNLTYSIKDDEISRKNDVHMRTSTLALISLTAYNPIANMHHISEVAQVSDAYFPANFTVTFSLLKQILRLVWLNPKSGQSPGFVAYSGSKVSIVSENYIALNDFCTKCKQEMLTTGDKTFSTSAVNMELNCDGSTTVNELILQLISSHKSNANVLPVIKPGLLILHALVLGSIPAKGPCKIEFSKKKSDTPKSTTIEIGFYSNKDNADKLQQKIGVVTRNDNEENKILSTFNVTSMLDWNEHNIKFVLMAIYGGPVEKNWKVCFEYNEKNIGDTEYEDIQLRNKLSKSRVALAFGNSDTKCPKNGLLFTIDVESKNFNSTTEILNTQLSIKNLPDEVSSFFSKYSNALSIVNIPDLSSETSITKLILSELSKPNAEINGSLIINDMLRLELMNENSSVMTNLKENNIPWLLDFKNKWDFLRKFGFIRECHLKEDKIIDINGNISQFLTIKSCELLLVGDCTNNPKFAIIKQPSVHGLAFKLYVGDSDAEIQPTETQINVIINGKKIDWQPLYQYPEYEKFYTFRVSGIEDRLKIESRISGLKLIYRRHEAIIVIPTAHLSVSCGACLSTQNLHTKC